MIPELQVIVRSWRRSTTKFVLSISKLSDDLIFDLPHVRFQDAGLVKYDTYKRLAVELMKTFVISNIYSWLNVLLRPANRNLDSELLTFAVCLLRDSERRKD